MLTGQEAGVGGKRGNGRAKAVQQEETWLLATEIRLVWLQYKERRQEDDTRQH